MPVLLFIVGINFVGVGALIPVLPLTVIESGYPASVMTLLLASYAFAMFIGNPVLGRLSDHFGRRLMLSARWLSVRQRMHGSPFPAISSPCSSRGSWPASPPAIPA